jgi:hypothetical protein
MTLTNTSWAKGESGNAKGRPPKGYSISETVRQMFETSPDLKKKLVKTMVDKAIEGDMSACKLIWSYVDGLPRQSTDPTNGFQDLKGLIVVKTYNKDEHMRIYKPEQDL